MSKILTVARHEYMHNLRKRSFLFSAFGIPVFVMAMMLLSIGLAENQETSTGGLERIGYVDQAEPQLIAESVDVPEGFIAYQTPAAAEDAMNANEIDAYFVIGAGYWDNGEVQTYTPAELPEGLEDQIKGFLHRHVAVRVPDEYAERLAHPDTVKLIVRPIDSPMEITEEGIMSLVFMPMLFAMIFMMATTITSQFLMQGVTAEKENRIMEILVTSCTPEQMLAGKVLGLGALGLTQLAVWAVLGGGALLVIGSSSPALQFIANIPPLYLIALLVYFVLGYMLYGTVMAGIGASVTAEQEGRQISGLLSLLVAVPFFAIMTFYQDPNGTLPVILSLIPFTAPMSVLLRLSLASVPMWQIGLSIALMVLGVIVAIWISARVFRLGMLMYGKRLRLSDIIGVIRSGTGQPIMTSAAGSEEGDK